MLLKNYMRMKISILLNTIKNKEKKNNIIKYKKMILYLKKRIKNGIINRKFQMFQKEKYQIN